MMGKIMIGAGVLAMTMVLLTGVGLGVEMFTGPLEHCLESRYTTCGRVPAFTGFLTALIVGPTVAICYGVGAWVERLMTGED